MISSLLCGLAVLLPVALPALPAAAAAAEIHDGLSCVGVACHSVPEGAAVAHRPAAEGECTACHRPLESFDRDSHSADAFDGDFSSREACAACHPATEGEAGDAVVHRPLQESPCTFCHEPHSSSFSSLLKADFPPEAYSVYTTGAYALCWSCHEDTLATVKYSPLATGFRLGSRNFHYSHLHKRRGITCRACHVPHGGPQDLLIRSAAPPGSSGWIETMVFQRDRYGGRCVGGCHKDISYRR